MKTKQEKSKEFFPEDERILIFSVNGKEKVVLPAITKNWDGKNNLIELLKKYHKTLEILENEK